MLNRHFLLLPEEILVDPSPFLSGASLAPLVQMKMELPNLLEAIGGWDPILLGNQAGCTISHLMSKSCFGRRRSGRPAPRRELVGSKKGENIIALACQ
jgi:hypothetical protein